MIDIVIAKTGKERLSQKRAIRPYGTGKRLRKNNEKTTIFANELSQTLHIDRESIF